MTTVEVGKSAPYVEGILSLFLGRGPHRVVYLDDDTGVSNAATGEPGSILLVVGQVFIAPTRLHSLLTDCHRCLAHDGRVGVLWANRLRLAWSGLRNCPSGRTALHAIATLARPWMMPSAGAVMRNLESAGFADIAAFSVSPTLDRPEQVTPLRRHPTSFSPAYLVSAGARTNGRPSLLYDIMRQIDLTPRTRLGPEQHLLMRLIASGKDKSIAFLETRDSPVVLRLPHSAAAQQVEEKAHEQLRALQFNADVAKLVPKPILSGRSADQPFFAERRISGNPLGDTLTASNRTSYLRDVERFLQALNPTIAQQQPQSIDGALTHDFVQPTLDHVLRAIGDAKLREQARALVQQSLDGAHCRIGKVHGDFSVGNILVDGTMVTGVIDWENFRPAAPPVLDAFNYLDSVHRRCNFRLSLADTVPLLAGGNWPNREEFEFLRRSFVRCDIDLRFLKGFALLYWLYHVGPQLTFAGTAEAATGRVEAVVRRMLG